MLSAQKAGDWQVKTGPIILGFRQNADALSELGNTPQEQNFRVLGGTDGMRVLRRPFNQPRGRLLTDNNDNLLTIL
jgi:hypothetical protein